MSKTLYFWDSVNYALAIEKFDVSAWRPSPPGYFIFIFIAKFFYLFISDHNLCMVIPNILSTGITAVLIFLFTMEIFDKKSAVIASLLFISSPVIWFHGETALTYMTDACFIMFFVYFGYKSMTNQILKYALISSFFLGISAGIRQQNTVLLFPLFLFFIHKQKLKNIILCFLALGITCLSWMIPLITLSGGIKSYLAVCEKQGACGIHPNIKEYSEYIIRTTGKIIRPIAKAITIGIIPLIIALILNFKKIKLKNPKTLLFIFWIMPCIIFWYSFHLGNPGHTFTCLMSIFSLTALAITKLKKVEIITIVCILINIFVFFFEPNPEKEFRRKNWFK
ncbi:glycosyltransferase family 39 protein, partial [bacterium]|nr:glycosyltransferase family 39 protein [bacterium]